ncbi:MAG: hypothetical protein WBK55_08235 [Alphaproteobacteria bacterium]
MPNDDFKNFQGGINGPYKKWVLVTPSNDDELEYLPRALFIAEAGDVALVGEDGNAEIFKDVAAGTILPVRPVKVLATGTDATEIIALY